MKWDAEEVAAREEVERARLRLVPSVPVEPDVYTPPAPPKPANTKPTTATELVVLAEELFEFGRSEGNRSISVPKAGPHFAQWLDAGFREHLAATFFERTGRAPGGQATKDAVAVLAAKAVRVEQVALHLRVARWGERVVIDRGDPTGQVVVIGPDGWELVERSPVLFRRTELTGVLPVPVRVPAGPRAVPGARLSLLRRLVNVDDESWPLLVTWLVCTMLGVPVPVLGITGEAGAAKTTAAKMLAELIDPSGASTRKPPADATRWIDMAQGSYVVAVDNMSGIPDWLSDSLCRAVTGEGDARRSMHQNDRLTVFSFRRAIILTGIDFGAVRGDLADRMLSIELGRITTADRLSDSKVAARFAAGRPAILGALYDLTSAVLATLPGVSERGGPRMIDFYRVALAVDQVTGSRAAEGFLRAAQQERAELALSDPFVLAIRSFVACQPGHHWSGTTGELLPLVGVPGSSNHEGRPWPRGARSLSVWLRRAVSELRAIGVEVDFERRATARLVHLSMTAEAVAAMSAEGV